MASKSGKYTIDFSHWPRVKIAEYLYHLSSISQDVTVGSHIYNEAAKSAVTDTIIGILQAIPDSKIVDVLASPVPVRDSDAENDLQPLFMSLSEFFNDFPDEPDNWNSFIEDLSADQKVRLIQKAAPNAPGTITWLGNLMDFSSFSLPQRLAIVFDSEGVVRDSLGYNLADLIKVDKVPAKKICHFLRGFSSVQIQLVLGSGSGDPLRDCIPRYYVDEIEKIPSEAGKTAVPRAGRGGRSER